jgi:hypothetical protein
MELCDLFHGIEYVGVQCTPLFFLLRNICENVKVTYPSLEPANKLFLVFLVWIRTVVGCELLNMFPSKRNGGYFITKGLMNIMI